MRIRRITKHRFRVVLVPGATAAAILCVAPTEVSAGFNPLKSIGTFLGEGVGSFADAAATPTIQTVERSGHNLIKDVNDKVALRIDQIDALTESRLNQVDAITGTRLNQTDAILTARISQIGVVANSTVAAAVGGLDQVAKRRIAQLEQSGGRLIERLGAEELKVLDHADQILHDRIGQLDDIVARSLNDVDDILRQRIEQVDDVAERRLGSADVMVTKQGVALEQSLIRIGALLAGLLFLVYVAKQIYADFFRFWQEHEERGDARSRTAMLATAKAAGFLALRLGVAGLCVGALLLFMKWPSESQKRLDALVAENRQSFEKSRTSLDFSRVRFYASQLSLLEPDETKRDQYRREARKFELARAVLSRPALLQSVQGVRDVTGEVAALEASGAADADLAALKAYVSYRVSESSRTREGEEEAALLAEQALALGRASADGGAGAVLKPLAAAVLRALLEDPVPESVVAVRFKDLSSQLASAQLGDFAPLASAAAYNRAVATLNQKSSNAFVAMLEAHANCVRASAALKGREKTPMLDAKGKASGGGSEAQRALGSAKEARFAAAQEVIAAWTEFDQELTKNEQIASSNVVFAVFALNDAILTQASWFDANPNAKTTAPRIRAVESLETRARLTPVRVEWARRYAQSLGRGASMMFGMDESERYRQYEEGVQAFVTAFVALRTSEPTDTTKIAELRRSAAMSAGALGLYQGPVGARQALGVSLLGVSATPAVRDAVMDEYRKRHMRML